MPNSVPASFLRFDKAVRKILDQSGMTRDGTQEIISLQPPSLKELTLRMESSAEFNELADELFRSLGADSTREAHNYVLFSSRLGDAVKRSGYYQGALSQKTPEEFWPDIRNHISRRTRPIRRLLLLDGCHFSKDQFPIGDMSITKFSKDEVAKFGANTEICNSFYPKELLDPKWYSQYWFLVEMDTRDYDPTHHYWYPEYISADVRLNRYWKPLLVLSLFSQECFRIPMILESEEGWELDTIQFSEPLVDYQVDDGGNDYEMPWSQYIVSESESARFDAFRLLCEHPLQKCGGWAPIQLAARRYLRAMFLSDPIGKGDDKDVEEDILLQYIMALEALLTGRQRRNSK
jgi:hypothetical protein